MSLVFLSLGALAAFGTACHPRRFASEFVVAPVKRAGVSEEKALRALEDYFEAARGLAILYDSSECHARCLYLALSGAGFSNKKERDANRAAIKEDAVCAKALRRYDKADSVAFGAPDSSWEGQVFGYVRHHRRDSETLEQDIRIREEEIGEKIVLALTQLIQDRPSNPVIPLVARDLGCVYEYRHATGGVDTYKEWLAATDPMVEPARLSPSWKVIQYRSLLRGCLIPETTYEDNPDHYVSCQDFEPDVEGDEQGLRTVGECSFAITDDNYLIHVIAKHCDVNGG